MRLLPFIVGTVLVLSAPVLAQNIALAPAKADCPPGEPDSLQVSWTAPCDTGDWLFDTQTGCRMWDWHPEPEDKAVWKGACHAGLPNGLGEAQWFEHGQPIDRFVGTYRNGKREGRGEYAWNDKVRFEGNYADDVPQGQGVVRIDGVVLSGDWSKGCLAKAGKVVAIGVPRSSCPPATGRRDKVADR